MNITLRQLEIFAEIAEYGNVTRAAEELFISQSAASMALAEFEKQLGEKLFSRSGKKLSLNESGRTLLPRVMELLARTAEIEYMFGTDEGELAGEVKVGASSTIGNYLITRYLGLFTEKNPGVKLSLEVGNTDQIINSLLDFNIDIGYIEGLCQHPSIIAKKWIKDKLVIFASPRHHLATKSRINLADLAEAKWILRESGSGTRVIFENALAGKVDNLQIGFEFGHTEAVKDAVKNNLGISCLSRLTLTELLRDGTLVELKTPFLDLSRNFYTLVHKQKYRSAVLEEFMAFIDMKNGR